MNWIQKFLAGSYLALITNLCWAEGVEDQILKNNLAYAEVIELNQYSPGHEKGLMLRLFATPAPDETCDLETGGGCKNKHVITSATFDELPEVQVHALQVKGEFVKADWADSKSKVASSDQAELILTFRKYHRLATRANPKLTKKFFRVKLKVTQQGIEETLLGK